MNIFINFITLGESNQHVPQENKEYFKRAIESIYEQVKSIFDLSELESIVVPENYKEELFAFQREQGHSEFMTDNEYGQGAAQVITVENELGKRHFIFISKNLIAALQTDEMLEHFKEVEGEYENALYCRRMAMNLLCHEFAHIHERSLFDLEKLEFNQGIVGPVKHLYVSRCKNLWGEYYACRMSCSTASLDPKDYFELVDTCDEIEKNIWNMRKKFNLGEVSINDFSNYFFEFLKLITNKMGYIHGYLNMFDQTNKAKMIEILGNAFKSQALSKLWQSLENLLESLFSTFPNWSNVSVFFELENEIIAYVSSLKIYMHDAGDQIYIRIPFLPEH